MENQVRKTLQDAASNLLYKNVELSHIVTAVRLPTGATEIAINTEDLVSKLSYILTAYDDDMCLKTNNAIQMVNAMVVIK